MAAIEPAPARYYALGLEYFGAAFHGWQRQPDCLTVQGSVEAGLAQILTHPVAIAAAGRTDRGVHATQQIASFSTEVERPLRAYVQGLNSHLPDAVRAVWAKEVSAQFHARFSAVARRYLYLFSDQPGSALADAFQWSTGPLDAARMHLAAQVLKGEQDFSAVRAAGCQAASPMRCVHRVSVKRFGELVCLDIEANAFLLHMVRNIASGLKQVGEGAQSAHWLRAVLAQRKRSLLGPTAPPEGLYFVGTRYPEAAAIPGPRVPPLLSALGVDALQ